MICEHLIALEGHDAVAVRDHTTTLVFLHPDLSGAQREFAREHLVRAVGESEPVVAVTLALGSTARLLAQPYDDDA